MFFSNLKTFYRNLKKYPLYTLINLSGLAIGLASSIMIFLWVQHELSYDRFHENSHRIFRVERDMNIEGEQMHVPITSPPLAPQLAADYPEIESFVRFAREDVLLEDLRQVQNPERMFFADSAFFQVFSFEVIHGDKKTCLQDPFSLALSRSAAKIYLGEHAEPGQVIRININNQLMPFTVTAIFEDFPANSHIQADIIGSFSSLRNLKHEMMMNSWLASFLYSYVLITDGADYRDLESQIQEMVSIYFGQEIRDLLHIDDPEDFLKIKLFPVTNIHLHTNRTWELETPGSITSVRVFSLVSLLLLLIAGINFMNLSTARASTRAVEIGVRKVSGANKHMLIRQFLSESMVFSFVSLICAFLLIELTLPFFSAITGKPLQTSFIFHQMNFPLILFAWITTAILAGIYPAFFLSAYQPAEVLKGKPGRHGGQLFRKILVIGQFIIAIGLIICAVTVFRHLQHINSKDLGYERNNLIDIPIEDRTLFGSFEAFKQDLLNLPFVEQVSRSMVIPTSDRFTDNPHMLRSKPDLFFPIINHIDEHYLPAMDINLIAGNNFSSQMLRDSSTYYIINETASRMFGFSSPLDALGEVIGALSGHEGQVDTWGRIVGICEDFHFQALTETIKPMVMKASYDRHHHIIIRTIHSPTAQENSRIREIWQDHFPNHLFISNLISNRFDAQHLTESRLQMVLFIFTLLSVFVACLGLLGLSAFSAEQRTREIGIRKTLGAHMFQIITMIAREFSSLIIIAGLIAIPLSYLILQDWLNHFPYHKKPEVWIFASALILAWVISMLTVCIYTYRVARANPADSLQSE